MSTEGTPHVKVFSDNTFRKCTRCSSQTQCFGSKVVVSTVSILATLTSVGLLAAGNVRIFGAGGLVKVCAFVSPAPLLTAKHNCSHNFLQQQNSSNAWRWGSRGTSLRIVCIILYHRYSTIYASANTPGNKSHAYMYALALP